MTCRATNDFFGCIINIKVIYIQLRIFIGFGFT